MKGNLDLDQIGLPPLNQGWDPTDRHSIDLHGSKRTEPLAANRYGGAWNRRCRM